jgi:UDP:flavonoid glycosyltransferase YjiC (YdhE family)
VFGDQPANAKEAEIKGYGISVPLANIKADALYNAIRFHIV